MRIPRASDRRLSTNMTPMIDVVFLLIIFFLVSSHLGRREARLPLDLPDAATHADDPPPEAVLTINVTDAGEWWVAGAQVDEQRMGELLAGHRDQHGPDAAVRVRTDRSVPYGRVEPLLRISAEQGLWNAAFAVRGAPTASERL